MAAAVLAAVCAGDCGPDAVDDPVRLVLGDLHELVLQVAALGGNERPTTLPYEVLRKCLVALAAILGVDTSEYSSRPFTIAQTVNDGIVTNLILHICLSRDSRECRLHRARQVPRR